MLEILVADDHEIVRKGLCSLLEQNKDFKIVAEARDGRTTVRLASELQPDIIIMDIAMPNMNGIEATKQIVNQNPEIKVIALSMHSDRRFVMEMLKAGVSAYLLKDSAFEELMLALKTVMKGKVYLSPEIAGTIVEDYRQMKKDETSAFEVLTEREREVLQLIAEGKPTKEIAASLNVSVKTIESHRQKIMNKLELSSIAELVKYAIRSAITNIEK